MVGSRRASRVLVRDMDESSVSTPSPRRPVAEAIVVEGPVLAVIKNRGKRGI